MRIETIRQLFRNLLSLGFSKAITGFLYFLLTMYLARVLGVENFGKYEFSIAFYVILGIVGTFGLDKIGTRDIARMPSGDKEGITGYVNRLVSLRLVTTILAFAALFAAAFLIPVSHDVKELIVFNGIGLLFSFISLEWFFMGVQTMQYVAYSRVLKAAMFLVLALLFVRSPRGLMAVPAARIVSVFLGIYYLVFVYGKRWGGIHFSPDTKAWKELYRKSYPILIAGIMSKVYLKFDALMIGFMLGTREVGFYAAVYRVVLFFIGIRTIGIASIFPLLSRFTARRGKELKELVQLSEKLAVMFAIPLGFGGMMLAPGIVRMIYGSAYLGAVTAFQILIWAFAAMGINFIFPQLQIAANRQKTYMFYSFAGIFANILLNLVLIPVLEINGAAIATLAAELISLGLFYYKSREIVKIKLHAIVIKPLAASLVFSVPLFFFKDMNISVTIGASGVVYFVLLLVLGYIKKNELVALKAMLRSRKA